MCRLFLLVLFVHVCTAYAQPAKIVAMVVMRNERNVIGQCLRALACYSDAIIVLDDASTDDSVARVEELARECRVEKIIRKSQWYRDEPGDKNKLLVAGREIGGTHFIHLDADELFTANCVQGDFLRNRILALQPGDRLAFTWYQLWRGIKEYRVDGYYKPQAPFVFCDDGKGYYHSGYIHTSRAPTTFDGPIHYVEEPYGVLHMQFVNWDNLLLKQNWYKCLERVRYPSKTAVELNTAYHKSEEGMQLAPANAAWFEGYGFFDPSVYFKPDNWRKEQIASWFDEYGKEYFRDLDIWNMSWE